MKARKDIYQERIQVKEEEKEKPKYRDDSTFIDQVQDIKYEDYSDDVVQKDQNRDSIIIEELKKNNELHKNLEPADQNENQEQRLF